MSTEIAVNQDDRVVTPDITGDDIAANLYFLRAAGLLPGILPTSEEPPAMGTAALSHHTWSDRCCKGPRPGRLGENEPLWQTAGSS